MSKGNKPQCPPEVVLEYLRNRVSYDPITGKLSRSTKHNSGYLIVNVHIDGRRYQLTAHHVAWFKHYGEWPKEPIDHNNRNKRDNSIGNLQYSDGSLQQLNTNKSLNRNLPPFVDKVPEYECYVARATIEGNRVYLGTFGTPEAAAEAVRRAKEQRANQRKPS